MNTEKFLAAHGQSSSDINIDENLGRFIEEMKSGLEGRGSLPMLPTFLSPVYREEIPPTNKRIIIDAGGTNFRSALGYFDGQGNAVFEEMQKDIMPGSDRRLTADEFYHCIAKNISRLLPEGGDIGFCFSYQVKMDESLDGIIEDVSKELYAEGLVGTRVGQRTLEAVSELDGRKRRIVILNDSVATLMGSLAEHGKKYSASTGYIYGTGTNICYSGTACGREMIINTECGNYDKFPAGDFDKELFKLTACPDKQKFEKMTSGKYLAILIKLCIEGAIKEGLLKTQSVRDFNLADVSEFLEGGRGVISSMIEPCDYAAVKVICENFIDRAAKLGAIANAAVIKISERKSSLPAAVFAEGTTFMRLHGYAQLFSLYLEKILGKNACEVIPCKDCNLTGTLAATLKI